MRGNAANRSPFTVGSMDSRMACCVTWALRSRAMKRLSLSSPRCLSATPKRMGNGSDRIMTSDKARLKNQLGTLSKNDMLAVEDAILVHLGNAQVNEQLLARDIPLPNIGEP